MKRALNGLLVCLALALIDTGCRPAVGAETQRGEFDYAGRIGTVYLDESGAPRLEIPTAGLTVGTAVTIVVPSFDIRGGQRLVEAVVDGRPRVSGRDFHTGPAPLWDYGLAVDEGSRLHPGTMGFAVLDAAGRCAASNAAVHCDLDSDGVPEAFRVCAGGEGLHFTVWSGPPLTGIRRWHGYVYVGYDMEPNCTNRDYPREAD